MNEQGAEFPDIEIRQSDRTNMRGVYAKRDFKEGETLLYVPDVMCITLDMIYNTTEIGKQFVEKNLTEG